MRRVLFACILLSLITLLKTEGFSATPTNFRYLGNLRQNGQLIDGIKTMRFRFTNSDGTVQYWDSGNVPVTVTSGYFSYELTPSVDWNNRPLGGYFFEVSVEGQVLLPREGVLSNIYSMHAGGVDDNVISEPKLTAAVRTKLNAVGGGDNLGNHVATMTLTMSGYDITGAGTIYAQKLSVSSFTMLTGATSGYFLQTDGAGNASWQSLGTLPGDNLGNHTATMDLSMSGFNIAGVNNLTASTFKMTTGATNGYILTSDAAGNASWQAGPDMTAVGLATATLRTDLTNLAVSTGTLVKKSGDTMTGKLTLPDIQITGGAGAGLYLKSDASGNASWASGSTSSITDHSQLTSTGTLTHAQLETALTNVGIATATLRTDLAGVVASTGSLVQRSGDTMTGDLNLPNLYAAYGVSASTIQVSNIRISSGAVNGYFLKTDGSGNASWNLLPSAPGDNLGDHTATTTLNMSSNSITNVNNISMSGNVNAASTSYFNMGDPGVDGTWRYSVQSGGLVFEKRISGNWETQATFTEQR